MARLQEFYRAKVVPDLIAKFGYKSAMQAPRITKITLNMGVSEEKLKKKKETKDLSITPKKK